MAWPDSSALLGILPILGLVLASLMAPRSLMVYPIVLMLYQVAHHSKPQRADTSEDAKDDAKKPATALRIAGLSFGSAASDLLALSVWPCICALPLAFTLGGPTYRSVFPAGWYDDEPRMHDRNSYGVADPRLVRPLGLALGIAAVAVGHVFTLAYHWLRRDGQLGETMRVQTKNREYDFYEGLKTHLTNPEGFVMLGAYLSGTWMLGWMPASYYSFAGGINWVHVFIQLLLQDGLMYVMHRGEHRLSSWIYVHSHKPHHRFTNPRLFDAFDGSVPDTMCMIVIPLLVTARLVPANVWSYMTFGTLYANWLTLIHSEYVHPWDWLFRKLGFGTAADHHVHHSAFVYNFGHLFMYWDKIAGTYRHPSELEGKFSKGV